VTAPQDVQQFIGRTAVGSDGSKIGDVGQVYLDEQTGQPLWVTVTTGMFGTWQSFAPIGGSRLDGDQVVLAVSKDLVKDAPNIDDDGRIDEGEQDALYQHYAGYLGDGARAGGRDAQYRGQDYPAGDRGDRAGQPGVQGRDTSGAATDDAMTRSEERLRVGTEQAEVGRVRLRKYVVTENVTQTVPVSHEEVRLEREPITDASRGQAIAGADITEEEHEVTLHAERPVVAKETVPVERVRLGKETVTQDQEVSETLRKEQIDDPDVDDNRPGAGR
jgi:uncharacterized protein (TIGR02271 family)